MSSEYLFGTGRVTRLVRAFVWSLCAMASVAALRTASAQTSPPITEFSVPGSGFEFPDHIVPGPDGNLWFTERNGIAAGGSNAGAIGRITPAGIITEFPLALRPFGDGQGTNPAPIGITVGPDPDGAGGQSADLWFTESGTNRIGRITTAGVVTTFTIPTSNSAPNGITLGPDGNIWFTELTGNKIGRLNPLAGSDAAIQASLTEFGVLTATSQPREIVTGPDGNLWFTESAGNRIGTITPAGTVTEFTVPTTSSGPYGIALGADGNLWFTERVAEKIGRITTAGVITEFAGLAANSQPALITSGIDPDGAGAVLADLWFTESGLANRIGRMTTAGTLVAEYSVPTSGSIPLGITAGPDNAMWFTENSGGPFSPAPAGRIGRLDLRDPTCGDGSCVTFVVNSLLDTGDATPDGACNNGTGQCTLREAIDEANAAPDLTRITFSIATGTQTILVNPALPAVKFPTVIDASTQPTYAGTPLIIVSGASAGSGASGLNLTGGYTTVRALALRNFNAKGIDVTAATTASSNNNLIVNSDLSFNHTGFRIQGQNTTDGNTGLPIVRGPGAATLQGNTITRNTFGVDIDFSSNNQVGFSGTGNTISGNSIVGVTLFGTTTGNVIASNRIGTDAAGTATFGFAQAIGIELASDNTLVGGNTAAARNIISANSDTGILIGSLSGLGPGPADNNTISGNYIGTNAAGDTALPNASHGIAIFGGRNNLIGGPSAGQRNLISGNPGAGIDIDSGSSANTVQGNFIGTNAAGTAGIPNGSGSGMNRGGIVIADSDLNVIGGETPGQGNLIAFNSGIAGVAVILVGGGDVVRPNRGAPNSTNDVGGAAGGNAIRGNSIHSNTGLGIDLVETSFDPDAFQTVYVTGSTPNDADDGDSGGNNLQNFPVLTSASVAANVTVVGSLNSTPSTQFVVQFFSNLAGDGADSEGRTYIGETTVTTDGGGDVAINATFAPLASVPDGSYITSTARRNTASSGSGSLGDTSEFSNAVVAVNNNNPPTITDTKPAAITMDEDSSPTAFSLTLNATDADNDTLTWSISSPATNGTATASGTGTSKAIGYTPNPNYNGTDSFTVQVSDGNGGTDTIIVNVTINPVADAPVITDSKPALVTMSEDGSPTPFSLTLNATDADGDTITWSISGPASQGMATASGTGTSKAIGYTPNANYNGTDSFTVQVSDGNGGTDTIVVNVTINPVNDAPTITDSKPAAVTMDEDGSPTAFNLTLNATDVEGDPISWSINGAATHGTATANGTGTSKAIGYTPAADYNGSDSFTVEISDGNGGTDTISVNVMINALNDAPTFQIPSNPASVNEDASAQTVSSFATNFQPGPVTATDESGQTLVGYTVTPTGTTGNVTFASGPSIDNAGTLTYTPTANTSGTATFNVTAQDSGSGTAPNVNTSAPVSFTITVNGENDAPTLDNSGNMSLTAINEDVPLASNPGTLVSDIILSAGGDRITDVDAGAGEGIAVIAVDNTNGAWQFSIDNGTTWAPFNSPTATTARLLASNATSRVRFVPNPDFNGPVDPGITFRAWDQSSGTNGGVADTSTTGGTSAFSASMETASIAVNAVNDAPSFTKGGDQTIGEDAGAQTVANWAASLSSGPANESGQTLSFTATNDNNALFSAQPSVSSTGTLTYTPAADANGTATVTVTLKDNGGTANGGQDSSAPETFVITVDAVNDAPSFTKGADQTVAAGSGTQTANNWATNILAGPSNESGQALNFIVTNNNNALFSTQPSVSSTGTLTYAPAAAGTGSATVSVSLMDNGGTAGGGQDTSAVQTFMITVTAQASPTPTATATATATATPTATATATPTATATASPTATATATPTATGTASPTATATASPTATATPTASPTASPTTAQSLNISTRSRVDLGNRVMIGGFIITGNAPKPVILRGMGPSLTSAGLASSLLLADPVLELHGASGLIDQNDNWKDSPQRAQFEGGPFQPADDREAVIVGALPPGAYTLILRGKNQTSGIGLVEIYDNDHAVNSQLGNISTRAFVQVQDNVVIAGFMLGANLNPSRIAVRGLGPSLASFGITDALADPTLELHNGNGTIMISNDNWTDDPASAAQLFSSGLAPVNALESGIFTTLPPGDYTAILAGKNGGVGVGLVEVYNLR